MPTSMLEELIQHGETDRTEFKAGVDPNAIGTTVASFLNANGGTILVGVGEQGELLGVSEAHATALRIWQSLAGHLSPTALLSVNVEEIAGKPVIVVDVPPGQDAPYVYDGRIAVRRGTQSRVASPREISSLILDRPAPHPRWERLPALGWGTSDLDESETGKMAQEVAGRRLHEWTDARNPSLVLGDLGLIREETLLNSAVILFARSPAQLYPQTRVRMTCFSPGDPPPVTQIRVLEGHAFALLRQIDQFLQAGVPIISTLPATGFQRTDTPAYPWLALREGVLNALAHRDYAAYDGGISISLFPDRIEIWNSGGFPEGVSVEDLKRGNVSRPQNPDIAHVFFLRGQMERIGSGGRRIVTECLNAGLPEPNWEQRGGGVMLTLWRSGASRRDPTRELSLRQTAFLEQTSPGERLPASAYHHRFAASVSERQARQDLNELVMAGYLSRVGSGRSTYYLRTDRRR